MNSFNNFLFTATNYLSNTSDYWEKTNKRQVEKLRKKIHAISRRENASEQTIIEEAVSMGILRARNKPATIYISNVGSSGSHWLESMLSEINKIDAAGEVYFPPQLRDEIKKLDKQYQSTIIDIIHLVHAWAGEKDIIKSSIINSAHYANLSFFENSDSNLKTILLKRNPRDISISRTFRKDQYREYVASESTDNEYLEQNCRKVAAFYGQALTRSYDLEIFYEQLNNEPSNTLQQITDILGLSINTAELDKIIFKHNKNNISKGIVNKPQASNLFSSDKPTQILSEHTKIIEHHLTEITKKLYQV